MKAIMMSDKPKWCALMMNGDKTKEIRKSKALATAIQKLIDEYGYADIYVYCSKDGYNHLHTLYDHSTDETLGYSTPYYRSENVRKWKIGPVPLNGKVVFKFRCYKVEEITPQMWTPKIEHEVLEKSCLKEQELFDYVCSHDGTEDKPFYAIHISDLEIFDRPKELSEFRKPSTPSYEQTKPFAEMFGEPYTREEYKKQCERFGFVLTKAPQNFCYVEVE